MRDPFTFEERVALWVLAALLAMLCFVALNAFGADAPPVPKIWDGKCTKEIAAEMGLSAKTVEWYRAELFKCFEVNNPVTLCRLALEAGLLKLR